MAACGISCYHNNIAQEWQGKIYNTPSLVFKGDTVNKILLCRLT